MKAPAHGSNHRRTVGMFLAALPVLEVLNLVLVADDTSRRFFSNLIQTLAAIVSAVLIIQAAGKLRREHDPAAHGWTTIGAAACSWAAGAVSFMVVEVVLRERSYPGFSDVFFLLFYLVTLLGLARLPVEPVNRRDAWNNALDLGALGLVAVTVVWHFDVWLLIQSQATQLDAAVLVSLLYTLLDTILLMAFFSRLVRKLGAGRQFVPMLLLVTGGFFLIAGDLLQGYVTTYSDFTSGSPVDLGWVLFSSLMGFAALSLLRPGTEAGPAGSDSTQPDFTRQAWVIGITYLWIVMVMGLLIWAAFNPAAVHSGILVGGAVGATVLAITRQIRSVREATRLSERLQQAHAELETKVAERTADLHRQTELLGASERKFRTLFETAHDAIFLVDEKGFLACNQKTEAIFGCRQQDILGRSPTQFSPPRQRDGRDSAEKAQEYVRAAFAGTPQNFEWLHQRLDGTPFDAEVSLNRVEVEGTMFLQAVVRDVTPRKRAEAQLHEEQMFNEAILNSVRGLVFLYDETGRLIRWNQQHESLTGYSAAELSGMHVLDWLRGREPDTSRAAAAVHDLLEKGHAEIEINLVTKDGRAIPYYFSGVRMTIAGQPYFTGIGLDLTVLKQAEAESQRLQVQLVQAQKMEAVGQLAGGVAHDFNNIVTAILLQLSMLQSDTHLSAEVRSGLKELEGEAKRAVNLTRQLLIFSRQQVLQPQVLDLNALLGNLLKMLRRLIGEHLSLEFTGVPGDLWLEADPGMLEQVVMNLVVNARDAMPGGGRVTLTTRSVQLDASACQRNPEACPGPFVRIAVTDTGTGIDGAALPRVFEPFFTTKEAGKGTGLGLATVYSIARQHRGWVEVETAIGRGSTFSLYLPWRQQTAAILDQTIDVASVPDGHENLLVVEDENSVRRALVEILGKLGYRVWEAGNGPDALQQWAHLHGQIDLVLIDVVMPGGISGVDLATRLLHQQPALKVILMSGYGPESVVRGLPQARGVRSLQKPFAAAALARMVRDCLDAD